MMVMLSRSATVCRIAGIYLAILCSASLGLGMVNRAAIADEAAYSKIYVGTYTGDGEQESKGIYVVDFDSESGTFGKPRLAAETTNPSFLTLNQAQTRLYSVAETRTAAGRSGAALIGWTMNDDGTLTEIGRAPTDGDGPCFVSLSSENASDSDDNSEAADAMAGVANYGGGSVALYKIASDGNPSLVSSVKHAGSSVNAQRQAEPHAHAFQFAPNGNLAFATDLGTDELIAYDIGQGGKLVRNERMTFKLPAGHGPRHFTFSRDGRFVLVIEELSSMITVLSIGDSGLKMVGDYSTLPENYQGSNSTAEIQFDPSGNFVYGSNRGHDSIAVFKFDTRSGQLTSLGHVKSGGNTPRNFRFSPDGKWLITANQSSDNLCVFRMNSDGLPQATGEEVRVSRPVCVKFAK